MAVLGQSSPEPPAEITLFEMLKGSLDERSCKKLQAKRDKMTFTQFWVELEQTFMEGDVTDRYRSEWERISVAHFPRLSLNQLRDFQTDFEIALEKLDGIPEDEKAKRFLQGLPAKLQEDVLKVCAKRQRGKFWVRVTRTRGMDVEALVDWLEGVAGRTLMVEDLGTHFMVDAGSK